MTERASKPDRTRQCLATNPADRSVLCGLPVRTGPPHWELEHEGPHGWDYERGEPCIVKRSDLLAQWRSSPTTAHLADRFEELEDRA